MVYSPSPKLRKMMQAAMNGDTTAAKALLKLYRYVCADEIKTGKPISPRIKRTIAMICIGMDTHWERILPDGRVENLLMQPPPAGKTRAREVNFDGD